MKNQDEGVSKASILSAILFSIKINNITKNISPGEDGYVDDFLIYYRLKYVHTLERKLQQCLEKIYKWVIENGFTFSKVKNEFVHFCHQRKLHNDPSLKFERREIPLVDECKFLGVIFHRTLTFILHLKYLKVKCIKTLQLQRVVTHA